MSEPKERTIEDEARRWLAWASAGGNIRQVDSVVLRDMDANEDEPKRVHLIPLGEAIGFAITGGRAEPDEKEIVWVSSHALAASFAALGFTVSPRLGGAIEAPRHGVPDYRPDWVEKAEEDDRG